MTMKGFDVRNLDERKRQIVEIFKAKARKDMARFLGLPPGEVEIVIRAGSAIVVALVKEEEMPEDFEPGDGQNILQMMKETEGADELVEAGGSLDRCVVDPLPDFPVDDDEAAAVGDPHMTTFDGKHLNFYKNMDFWFVHSPTIQIQGMATGDKGYLQGLAAGGEWMKGHSVVIWTKEKWGKDRIASEDFKANIEVFCDGKPCLQEDGQAFSVPGVMELNRRKGSEAFKPSDEQLAELEGQHHKGTWEKYTDQLAKAENSVFHFKLPKNTDVFLYLGWAWEVVIKAPAQTYQGGWCGNFNGESRDDDRGIMMDAVDTKEDLFIKQGLRGKKSFLQEEKDDADEKAPDGNCTQDLKAKATQACSQSMDDAAVHADCIADICLTGDVGFAKDAVAMELMEVVEARGSVLFQGSGKCTDSVGQNYAALESTEIENRRGCVAIAHVVAHLAPRGIRGVQFKEDGSTCQQTNEWYSQCTPSR